MKYASVASAFDEKKSCVFLRIEENVFSIDIILIVWSCCERAALDNDGLETS